VTTEPEYAGSDTDEGDEELELDPYDRLTTAEKDDLTDAETAVTQVSYSGQDFDAAGLVRRLSEQSIVIPTFGGRSDEQPSSARFQRSFVWNRKQMDRFIESLLLGYPVPGVFLVRQADRRYLVLDGQQRLRTLEYFVAGDYQGRAFALQNVAEEFQNLTYGTLPEELRRLFDDTFIPATIVSTDGTSESLEAIYQIFERLNAGGTQLTPHEIRVALFAGPFIDFLERLNEIGSWRDLYGRRSPRLRDQELVLRILAFYLGAPTYKRPLKTFLNNFVAANRDLTAISVETLEQRFSEASELLRDGPGREGLRRQSAQLNVALTEALFVGLMKRLDYGSLPTSEAVSAAVTDIRSDTRIEPVISRATADEESVRTRLEVTTGRFAES
jgi:hypothetical protein